LLTVSLPIGNAERTDIQFTDALFTLSEFRLRAAPVARFRYRSLILGSEMIAKMTAAATAVDHPRDSGKDKDYDHTTAIATTCEFSMLFSFAFIFYRCRLPAET
jgi:hypothetical protein